MDSQTETMNDLVPASDFAELFVTDAPLLDVRAPLEFQRGAFPGAVNLPLLDDRQRQEVGRRYREAGQAAAITLGHELIHGEVKARRLQQWQAFIENHPDARLYCFRGGQRSQIVQHWLADKAVSIARIAGGYKALRRFLLETLDILARQQNFTVIAGKTGSAKTHLLHQLSAHIDLEGYARHRGSAFGSRLGGQPTQINFENTIAIAYLKLLPKPQQRIFIEDESHAIGSLSVPRALHQAMSEAPLAVIEETWKTRVDTILNDYIIANYTDLEEADPDTAQRRFADYLLGSLDKIRRRLGGDRHARLRKLMEIALREQQQTANLEPHRVWIEKLLLDYYDPMYDYQLNSKKSRIVFRGNRHEFLEWARTLSSDT